MLEESVVVVDLKRVLDLVDLEREKKKILMLMLLTWANKTKRKPRSFFLLIIPKMPSASGRCVIYSRV